MPTLRSAAAWFYEKHHWDTYDSQDDKGIRDGELVVKAAREVWVQAFCSPWICLTELEYAINHQVDNWWCQPILFHTLCLSTIKILIFWGKRIRFNFDPEAWDYLIILDINFIEPFGKDEKIHPTKET